MSIQILSSPSLPPSLLPFLPPYLQLEPTPLLPQLPSKLDLVIAPPAGITLKRRHNHLAEERDLGQDHSGHPRLATGHAQAVGHFHDACSKGGREGERGGREGVCGEVEAFKPSTHKTVRHIYIRCRPREGGREGARDKEGRKASTSPPCGGVQGIGIEQSRPQQTHTRTIVVVVHRLAQVPQHQGRALRRLLLLRLRQLLFLRGGGVVGSRRGGQGGGTHGWAVLPLPCRGLLIENCCFGTLWLWKGKEYKVRKVVRVTVLSGWS